MPEELSDEELTTRPPLLDRLRALLSSCSLDEEATVQEAMKAVRAKQSAEARVAVLEGRLAAPSAASAPPSTPGAAE